MVSLNGSRLRLIKFEGAGNDFLVVDPASRADIGADAVRALCDRSAGVGADGVIRVSAGSDGADLAMELWNADGSRAAMSGNGIRCLALAAVESGMVEPPRFTVATDAGVRSVSISLDERPGSASASVDMGPIALGEDQPQRFADRRVRSVDVGNPHLVLFGPDDPATVAVAELGPRIAAGFSGGVNVEFVAAGAAPDELVMRVWERGVGETRACGTGSCAAAAAARSWGLVGRQVRVRNPGGVLEVALGVETEDPVRLAGPVRRVAEVSVDPGSLSWARTA